MNVEPLLAQLICLRSKSPTILAISQPYPYTSKSPYNDIQMIFPLSLYRPYMYIQIFKSHLSMY